MQNLRFILILIIIIAFFSTNASIAKMYQWTDENGVTHFSDTPPPDPEQTMETYETSKSSSEEPQPEQTKEVAEKTPSEESSDLEEITALTTADILGKWRHLGIANQLSSKKLSKPYKPQTWEFMNNGTVIYTIGNKTNSFPYKIQGKTIITTPFPNQDKSFVAVKKSYDRMIWKDPGWDSYVHVERIY